MLCKLNMNFNKFKSALHNLIKNIKNYLNGLLPITLLYVNLSTIF